MIRKSGYGFPKRSCSNKKIERDDDSKKSHHALRSVEAPDRPGSVWSNQHWKEEVRVHASLQHQMGCLSAEPEVTARNRERRSCAKRHQARRLGIAAPINRKRHRRREYMSEAYTGGSARGAR